MELLSHPRAPNIQGQVVTDILHILWMGIWMSYYSVSTTLVGLDYLERDIVVVVVIITLPLRLNASGQRINIIMLTNDTSFRPCSISLYFSLPRKLIGPLDPSSPVRLMAAT